MIEAFTRALHASGVELDARNLADALWLAVQRSRAGGAAEREVPPRPPPGEHAAPRTDAREDAARAPVARADEEPAGKTVRLREELAAGVYASAAPSAAPDLERRASRVQVSRVAPLPNALALGRALRPLMRKFPSLRSPLLDAEATVQAFGRTGVLSPVFAPGRERWFEVALVVDPSPSMVVWKETLRDFARLLAHHGAFRQVRRFELELGGSEPLLESESGLRLRVSELNDPSSRTLVLVLTECVHESWRSALPWRVLAEWSASNPVALVQLLPQRAWVRTGLGAAGARFHALRPGARGRDLQVRAVDWWDEPAGERARLPVVTLEARTLGPLARVVMGSGGASVPGVLLPKPLAPAAPAPDGQPPSAEDLVARFKRTVHPVAHQLAIYFSAIPLRLPVMGLVQHTMLPDSHQRDLAEFFVGGLIRRVSGADVADEEVEYEFKDGVREVLWRSLTISGTHAVLGAVSRYVERTTGEPLTFGALVDDAAGVERLPQAARAFATLGAEALGRLRRGTTRGAGATWTEREERVFARGLSVRAELAVEGATRVAWAPDGSRFAVARPAGVVVFDARGVALETYDDERRALALGWGPGSGTPTLAALWSDGGEGGTLETAPFDGAPVGQFSKSVAQRVGLLHDPLDDALVAFLGDASVARSPLSDRALHLGAVAGAATESVVSILFVNGEIRTRTRASTYEIAGLGDGSETRLAFYGSLALSGDGSRLAAYRQPNEVHLGAAAATGALDELKTPIKGRCQLALSHDGRLLATRSEQNMLRLWRTATRELVVQTECAGSDLAFSPTAPQLAVVRDGVALLLTVDEQELLGAAPPATSDCALLVDVTEEHGGRALADLVAFLTAPDAGGVPAENVHALESPSLAEFRDGWDVVMERAADCRRLYLYFGGPLLDDARDEIGALVLATTRKSAEAVQVAACLAHARRAGPREVVALVEAAKARRAHVSALFTPPPDLDAGRRAEHLTIVSPARARASLHEFFLDGLGGGAADFAGSVSASSMAAFLRDALPEVLVQTSGDFELARVPGERLRGTVTIEAPGLTGEITVADASGSIAARVEAPAPAALTLTAGPYVATHAATRRSQAFVIEAGFDATIRLAASIVVIHQTWDEEVAALVPELEAHLESALAHDVYWDDPNTDSRTIREEVEQAQLLVVLVGPLGVDTFKKNRLSITLVAARSRGVRILPVLLDAAPELPPDLASEQALVLGGDVNEDAAALAGAIEALLAGRDIEQAVAPGSDEPRVWVSANRASLPTLTLFERLQDELGHERVKHGKLFDRDNDYETLSSWAAAEEDDQRVVVAMIEPDWSVSNERGARPLDDPRDPIRADLERALQSGMPTVLVLLHGAHVPASADLPQSLAPLPELPTVGFRWTDAQDSNAHEVVEAIRRVARHGGGFDLERSIDELAKRVEGLRHAWQEDPDTHLPTLARSLVDLANRFHEAGRLEEAEAAIEESLTAHELLERRRPGAYLREAAWARTMRADILRAAGADERAYGSALQAVEALRQVHDEEPQSADAQELLAQAYEHAASLAPAGLAERLRFTELAVEARRAQAAAEPERFQLALARALVQLASERTSVEGATPQDASERTRVEGATPQDASEPLREAVALFRRVGDDVLDEWAAALRLLQRALDHERDAEELVAASEEAVALRRRAHERGGSRVSEEALADELIEHAFVLKDFDQGERALDLTRENLAIRRRQSAADPQDLQALDRLAEACNYAGHMSQDPAERRQLMEEYLAMRRSLANADPDEYRLPLGRALVQLSTQLALDDDRTQAAAAAREAVALFRELGDAALDRRISAMQLLTTYLDAERDAKELLATSEELVAMLRRVAEIDPSEASQHTLAIHLLDHARVLQRLGHLQEAQAVASESGRLFDALPEEPEFEQSSRGELRSTLLELYAELDRPEEAFEVARETAAWIQRSHPKDAPAQAFLQHILRSAARSAEAHGWTMPANLASPRAASSQDDPPQSYA